jgi:hypothetical protein
MMPSAMTHVDSDDDHDNYSDDETDSLTDLAANS